MTQIDRASDYPGQGELPDGLAFLPPSRADVYVTIRNNEGIMAAEIEDRLDCSRATVFRSISDLREIGAIEHRAKISTRPARDAGYHPTASTVEVVSDD